MTNYTIQPKTQKRVTRFENGTPIWEEYTQYDILKDGKMVQFCFREEDIEKKIRFLEEGDGIDPIYFTGLTAG